MLPQLRESLGELLNSPFYNPPEHPSWAEVMQAADVERLEDLPDWLSRLIERGKESYKAPWKYVRVRNRADFYAKDATPLSQRWFAEPILLGKVGPSFLIWLGSTPEHPKIVALCTPDGNAGSLFVTAVSLDALLATLQAPVEWEPGQRPQEARVNSSGDSRRRRRGRG